MADPTHLPETLDPAAAAGSGGYGGDTVPDLSLTLRPPRHRAISDGVGGVGFDSAGSNLSLSLRAPLRGASDSDSASMLHVSGLKVDANQTDETDSDHLKLTLGLPNRAIPAGAVEAPEHPVQDTRFAGRIVESEAEYRLRIENWFLSIGNETRSAWSTDRMMLEEAALADMDDLQVDSEDMDDASSNYLDDAFSYYTYEEMLQLGLREEDDSPIRGAPAAAAWVVDNLPSFVLTGKDVADDKKSCAVCKEDFDIDQIAKKLPCSHYYHEQCILPWLEIRNTCPLCRFELLTDDPDYEELKEELAGIGASSGET